MHNSNFPPTSKHKHEVNMENITKVEVQKNDKTRVNLFLNGKYFCALDLETAVKNRLKSGTIITIEEIEKIQLESEKQTAYSKALKLISTRYKTQREVEKYLFDKGYLAPVVFYVIQKLIEYHYVDDNRYAQSYIATHKSTCGPQKLRQNLMQKGIKQSVIDAIIDENFDQSSEILALANKYMKSKEQNAQNYAKLIRYLLSKGFEYDAIKNTLKSESNLE